MCKILVKISKILVEMSKILVKILRILQTYQLFTFRYYNQKVTVIAVLLADWSIGNVHQGVKCRAFFFTRQNITCTKGGSPQ